MSKLLVLLCCLIVTFLVAIGGCSSKKEEVALASTQPAPAVESQTDDTATGDSSMNDGTDDGANSADDSGTNDTVDDGSDSTTDDPSMTETASGDDASMTEADASMTDADGAQVAVRAKPKNLREQAVQAFGDGYEKAAYRLMQAHALSSSADASEILGNYRWSPSRRQPQLGARIAVGVSLTAPSEIKDYKPIGSLRGFFKNKVGNRNRGVVAGVQNQDGEEPATLLATNNKERILQKYTGLMGDVLVNHLKSTHGEGKWAPIFQSLTGGANTPTQFSNDIGIDDGSGSGDDTSVMSGPISMKTELSTKIEGDEAKYISVGPAISFIGTGTSAELLDQAKAGEFDALIVFDVEVTINLKLRMIYNECRAKLINFADGKSLAASKLLKNTEAQKEIDKTGRAFVETAMQPILSKLDETVAMKEIPPALTPEIIKTKRLSVLVSDETRSKLDSLSEIRLYREKALLDDEDVKTAFEAILGPEDGIALATGSDEQRLQVVKKLLANSK